jgi:hypothetical protein
MVDGRTLTVYPPNLTPTGRTSGSRTDAGDLLCAIWLAVIQMPSEASPGTDVLATSGVVRIAQLPDRSPLLAGSHPYVGPDRASYSTIARPKCEPRQIGTRRGPWRASCETFDDGYR